MPVTYFSVSMPANSDSGSVASGSFLDAPTNFSISVWLKCTSTSTNWPILGKRDTTAGGNGWFVFPNNTTGLLSYQADNVYRQDASTNSFSDGLWHNVVITNTGTTDANFYVDGILATSAEAPGPPAIPTTNVRTFHLGTDTNTQTMTNLSYANVKLWNTTLTQGNATTLAGGGDVPSGQVANWNFSEGSGTTATDTIASRVLTFSHVTWSTNVPAALGAVPQRMLTGMGL